MSEKTYKVKLKSGGKLSASKAKEMLKDGSANGKKLTDKQKRYFGWIAGGKAEEGASITPLSGDFSETPVFQFNGPSHANGGIDIQYGGNRVNVEGEETAFIDRVGDLNILGNMYVPGTKMKFKTAGKKIAEQEEKNSKQLDRSLKLINEANPYDRFERFKFNSGMVMADNAARKKETLQQDKEFLATLQEAMLISGEDKSSGKAQEGEKVKARRPQSSLPFPMRTPAPLPNQNQFMNSFFSPQTITTEIVEPQIGTTPVQQADAELSNVELGLTRGVQPANASKAVRHNNPGNIMYNPRAGYQQRLGAQQGEARYDSSGKLIGHFAKFPDIESGKQALQSQLFDAKSYKNLTVDQAARRWVYGSENSKQPGYQNIPADLKGKKISSLSPEDRARVLDTFTMGEDSKRYNWEGLEKIPTEKPAIPTVNTAMNPPNIPVTYTPNLVPYDPSIPPVNQQTPPTVEPPPYTIPEIPDLVVPPERRRDPFRNPLRPGQIAGEAFTLATERPEFVPGQRYEPELYQDFEVSYQDRLNENNASFRAAARQLGGNPSALSALAAQKYQADSQVLADEFRTNQQVSSNVTNMNTQLLNEAERINIELGDQQFVRQTQAEANTRENIRNAMNSIASKFEQNRTETLRYNAYSELFPQYQANRYGQFEYIPNEEMFFGSGASSTATGLNPAQRTRETYDRTGALRETIINTPSQYQQREMEYDNWRKEMQNRWMMSDKMRRGR